MRALSVPPGTHLHWGPTLADQRIGSLPAARSLYRSRVFSDRKPLKFRRFLENDSQRQKLLAERPRPGAYTASRFGPHQRRTASREAATAEESSNPGVAV